MGISTLEPIRNGIFMELATLFLHGSPSAPYESLRKSNAAISYFLAQKCQKEWKPQQAIHRGNARQIHARLMDCQ